MPRFYERVGGGNGYVKGRVDGAFCTWQSTAGGTRKLLEKGYGHGDEIDPWLFQQLIDSGDLYTGSSGLTASSERERQQSHTKRRKRLESASSKNDGVIEFDEVWMYIIFPPWAIIKWLLERYYNIAKKASNEKKEIEITVSFFWYFPLGLLFWWWLFSWSRD